MKCYALSICFLFLFLNCHSQNDLNKMMDNVYLIGYDMPGGMFINATAFQIEIDNVRYLATSSHVFQDVNSKSIRMFSVIDDSLKYFDAELLRHTDPRVDVILIKSSNFSFSKKSLEIGGAPEPGDECIILGFPYGLYEQSKPQPTPILRKGTVSAYGSFSDLSSIKNNVDSEIKGIRLTIADIISDPGFSGSPLIVGDKKSKKLKVVGVVGGPMLPYVHINNTPIQVNYGITRAFDAQYFHEILEEN